MKLLRRLQIDSGGTKARGERVAEAVPGDDLVLDAPRSGVGRTIFFNTMSGLTGFLPFSRIEGNTKSSCAG